MIDKNLTYYRKFFYVLHPLFLLSENKNRKRSLSSSLINKNENIEEKEKDINK